MKDRNDLRFIISQASNGPENMAIDESLFIHKAKTPESPCVFRLYKWNTPYTSIGYFQKIKEISGLKYPVIRRFTGGLALEHNNDLSYSFTASYREWKSVYNQSESYRIIHNIIKKALESVNSNILPIGEDKISGEHGVFCSKTYFPNDLALEGKKILGSCQRRRGDTILQQGSISYGMNNSEYKDFIENLVITFEKETGFKIQKSSIKDDEHITAKKLVSEKYSKTLWNNKY